MFVNLKPVLKEKQFEDVGGQVKSGLAIPANVKGNADDPAAGSQKQENPLIDDEGQDLLEKEAAARAQEEADKKKAEEEAAAAAAGNNSNKEETDPALEDRIVYQLGLDAGLAEVIDLAKLPDDYDGLKQLITNARDVYREVGRAEILDEEPLVKEFYEHIKQGLSIDSFKKAKTTPELVNTDLSKQPKQVLSNIIREDYKALGMSDTIIDTVIDKLEDDPNALLAEAKKVQIKTKEVYERETKGIIEAEAQARKAEEAAMQKMLKDVETAFKSNDFNGKKIPEADLKTFQEWIFKGGRQEAYEKLSTKDALYLDYLFYKGFDNVIIKAVDKKDALEKVRENMKNSKGLDKFARQGNDNTKAKNPDGKLPPIGEFIKMQV